LVFGIIIGIEIVIGNGNGNVNVQINEEKKTFSIDNNGKYSTKMALIFGSLKTTLTPKC